MVACAPVAVNTKLALTNSAHRPTLCLESFLQKLTASRWPEEHSWEQHEQFPSPAIYGVIVVVPCTLGFLECNSQSPAERSLQDALPIKMSGKWNSSRLAVPMATLLTSNSTGAPVDGGSSISSTSSSGSEVPLSHSTCLRGAHHHPLAVVACDPLPKRDSTGDGPSVRHTRCVGHCACCFVI